MKALITGATSGIGMDIARELASKGYDLYLVGRREERLKKIQEELKTNIQIYCYDLSDVDNCYRLYEEVKKENIDILVNNAGYGLFGEYVNTDLNTELNMIDLNIKCVHILTKLFLKDFYEKNKGYILNVASSAGFLAGPRLNTYYATKNYVLKLSMAIYEELRRNKKNISISVLCPGPVNTEFNQVAKGSFSMKGLSSEYVAKYAVSNMFKHKLIIIPGFSTKMAIFLLRFLPYKLQLRIIYNIQKRKEG